MEKVKVYIEIEKFSNIKYEYDKKHNKLCVDRILPYPYFYPYAYGFIPNTIALDNDELDICLITDISYKNDVLLEAYIIGGISMEDEKGMDEKILVVPVNEYDMMLNELEKNNIINDEKIDNILWFFSNYKNKTKNKWSKVHKVMTQHEAVELYHKCRCRYDVTLITENLN